MDKTLYFFADTNLFIECRALEELPWDQWQEYEEIHIIITPPVTKEIDNRKKQGNDRVGRKARKANSLFKEIIISDGDFKLIKETNPTVKLFIKSEYTYTNELADKMNLAERDEQLVATIYDFKNENPSLDVRLLSHDSYPLSVAKGLGISFYSIPDHWLLPAENSQTDKQIQILQTEVSRLKKQEPELEISCVNEQAEKIEKYCAEYQQYTALTNQEIDELLELIKSKNPKAENFNQESLNQSSLHHINKIRISGLSPQYIPPTEEEISDYNQKYDAWLCECEEFLKNYHTRIQYHTPRSTVTFVTKNVGTRPAKDALLSLEAKGSFQIMPPPKRDEDDEEGENRQNPLALPRPPSPPKGKMGYKELGNLSRSMDDLFRSFRSPVFGEALSPSHLLRTPFIPSPPDPNKFYYKESRPNWPCCSYELECEQWRHATDYECFSCEIHPDLDKNQEEIKGSIECKIHAENLSHCETKILPVKIEVKAASTYQKILELIDPTLAEKSSIQSKKDSNAGGKST